MPESFNLQSVLEISGVNITSAARRQLESISLPKLNNIGSASEIGRLNSQLGNLSTQILALTGGITGLERRYAGLDTATKRASTGQAKLNTDIKKSASNIEDFADKAGLALRRFTAFSVAAGGVFGTVRTITGGLREAVSFERELLRVSQVTRALPSQIQGVRDTIAGLGAQFGAESKDLVDSAKILSQAGLG